MAAECEASVIGKGAFAPPYPASSGNTKSTNHSRPASLGRNLLPPFSLAGVGRTKIMHRYPDSITETVGLACSGEAVNAAKLGSALCCGERPS